MYRKIPKPKYKIDQVLICRPGLVFDIFLNKKYTVQSIHFDEQYKKYKYRFQELDINIYENALATIEELRDDKLNSLLK